MIRAALKDVCVCLLAGTLMVVSMSGCGGGSDGAADGSTTGGGASASTAGTSGTNVSGRSLPEHNPDARFEGKTALEYAAELSDLSPEIQTRALVMLMQFGVDGLPARDTVREMVNASRAMPEIRLLALGVLLNMQDPNAVALAREKLADSEFLANDVQWRDFISGLRETDSISETMLQDDVLRIASHQPAHASRLMMLRALPSAVQQVLTKAVFESDYDQSTRNYFLANFNSLEFLGDESRKAFLTDLVEQDIESAANLMTRRSLQPEFQEHLTLAIFNAKQLPDTALAYFFQSLPTMGGIDDEAKIEFIRSHAPFASRPQYLARTHQILLSVGTEEAMDLALRFGAMMPEQRFSLMIQFAQAGTDPNVVFDRMMRDMKQAGDDTLSNQLGGYIETLVLKTAHEGEQGALLRERFLSEFGRMIHEAERESLRAIAVLYLVSYVRQAKDVPALPALEPAFAILKDASAPDIVRGTAGAQLTEAAVDLARRDGFIKRAVQALWEGDDINATHFPEEILRAVGQHRPGVRRTDLADCATRVLEELLSDIDEHLEHWSLTPATAIMLTLAGDVNSVPQEMYNSPIIERTSIALGRILVNGKVHPGYKNDEMRFALSTLVHIRMNTLDGLIGVYEPILLAQQPTVAHQLLQDRYGLWAASLAEFATYTTAAKAEPVVQERWRSFLQRLIDAQIPEVSHYAEVSLAKFEQHRAR